MKVDLWSWGGRYIGYRDGDDLWCSDGRLLGRFHGDEVYGTDGHYLGEIRDGDRLIRKTMHSHPLKGAISPRLRGAAGVRGTRGIRGTLSGYEDFPNPDNLR